eukprot:m.73126 g.73126  ORF g.73126 m.73126 type:complete len:385 (-) comp16116_c0_seq7:271-1425(-)
MSGLTDNRDLEKDPAEVDRLEQEHFKKIVLSMFAYRNHFSRRIDVAERSFHEMNSHYKDMLAHWPQKMEALRGCCGRNAKVLEAIGESCPFGTHVDAEHVVGSAHLHSSQDDMDKVYTTLKQLVRDWSEDGAAEREKCYGPVLCAIENHFGGSSIKDRSNVHILVPGAGLGRLVWECAHRGYTTQGNEWSVHMLLASNHMLNGGHSPNSVEVSPFAHNFSNNYGAFDQQRIVRLPDVDTQDLPGDGGQLSMSAGDFLEIYDKDNAWDCIASVFFLDTARIVMAYLEHMFTILKPGGLLINIGPLQYHFSGNVAAPSVELSFEELRELLSRVGFVLLEEKFPLEMPYIDNERSMGRYMYKCAYFVAQKPAALSDAGNLGASRPPP